MAWRSAYCRKPPHKLAGRNPLMALVHHPLALEWGLSAGASRAHCAQANGRHSQRCKRVIVTSAATARLVASDYGVPAERITVAMPGSDPAPLAQGSRGRRRASCFRSAQWCRAKALTC